MLPSPYRQELSARYIGIDVFFQTVRNAHAAGYRGFADILSPEPNMPIEAIRDEWLYLEVFSLDFGTFSAVGNTPVKDAILTPFYAELQNWLQQEVACGLPERYGTLNGPFTVPPEESEIALERLRRRMKEYSAAIAIPHHMGSFFAIGARFAANCGNSDIAVIMAASGFFSSSLARVSGLLAEHHVIV